MLIKDLIFHDLVLKIFIKDEKNNYKAKLRQPYNEKVQNKNII